MNIPFITKQICNEKLHKLLNIHVKKEQKKLSPGMIAQKNKKESKKKSCQCGTTLMSLVTSRTLASLLLSSAKFLSFNNNKKKKNT